MTPPKERNIPAGTSPLAGPPKLTPKVSPLRVGGRGDGQEEEHDQEEPPEPRQAPRPGRTRGGKRPAPEAATAVPTTVRFDPEEASEVDHFVLMLRDESRRTRLDKAEVVRELLRLAREDDSVRKKLLRRIRA
ncbi:hypothetical protein QMK19_39570 [Streptomyces sp. H10-C2]|uniref:hypothetical protein n=1 Tax=unclassified Streptomyces TaxID=2593676 RepID=UPI0024BB900A|nr:MULTISPECIES: hypothetical protein [unclassified Streptomyces]MDJ0347292.1 hypothetical protein [Streptomyces sp. PH10-H1]MDJ0375526.1 hypothetical protein [Streptomyces sp. H10-C2]